MARNGPSEQLFAQQTEVKERSVHTIGSADVLDGYNDSLYWRHWRRSGQINNHETLIIVAHYFRDHHISVATFNDTYKYLEATSVDYKLKKHYINNRQRKWQASICTDYLFMHARTIYYQSLDKTPPINMLNITRQERVDMLEQLWPPSAHERKVIAYEMYRSFARYIDFDTIFEPPLSSLPELEAICRPWQDFIKDCYVLGIEDSINIRLRARHQSSSDQTRSEDLEFFRYWKDLTVQSTFTQPLPIEYLPIIIDQSEVRHWFEDKNDPGDDFIFNDSGSEEE
ncbi:hypothetical protein BU24DRAFT_458096 [Aaosphaeria arxii CBS 175.79]|uniref:Uncharacterized protein n=1 Tax=Aaosphaeria arxii CBS 175.79 TaxID=1450172 RepID=A0A6A5YC12_9PLEO|nr:uncharacterized protein BU24DRAFT_458096 [Aaosphaeria arxii CBS 175.79]KAF2022220.1 hypothetical protein BU24DRAFT_458096 [Aaosphaeria arxii CBS 175.79]